MNESNSEVTRLLTQIDREYEAAQRGLSGIATGAGQHRFMTQRMEKIAELHGQVRDLVGDEVMRQIDGFDPCADCETHQKCEADGCPLPNDQKPELVAIAKQLRETKECAIRPAFVEELSANCLTTSVHD